MGGGARWSTSLEGSEKWFPPPPHTWETYLQLHRPATNAASAVVLVGVARDAIVLRVPAESGDDRRGPKLEVQVGPRVAPAFVRQVGANSLAVRVVAYAIAGGVKIEIPAHQLGQGVYQTIIACRCGPTGCAGRD